MLRPPPRSTLFPYTTLFRSRGIEAFRADLRAAAPDLPNLEQEIPDFDHVRLLSVSLDRLTRWHIDRKSTRLNSSHVEISYAVFCLKKKKNKTNRNRIDTQQ